MFQYIRKFKVIQYEGADGEGVKTNFSFSGLFRLQKSFYFTEYPRPSIKHVKLLSM